MNMYFEKPYSFKNSCIEGRMSFCIMNMYFEKPYTVLRILVLKGGASVRVEGEGSGDGSQRYSWHQV